MHLSPWMHQEYPFRHRRSCRTSAENGQASLITRKEYTDPCKIWQDERRSGKNGRVSRTAPAHGWVGDLKQGSVPLTREIVRDTGEAFGAVGECRKCTHTHTHEYYSAIKKENIAICENLDRPEGILLSEISQRQILYEILKQT